MGLLDFFFGKTKKPPSVVLPKYSPLEPYIEKQNTDLDQITAETQARSKNFQSIHDDNISSFDYRSIQSTKGNQLSCVEKSFLKYVCGRPVHNTYIAGYWTHTYGIDYQVVMSKFFNLGLLDARIDLQNCTVKSLKDLLRTRGLRLSGKKCDLITRLESSGKLSSEELDTLDEFRRYTPTKTGAEMVSAVVDSATNDTNFEDEVITLLQEERLDDAYRRVVDWETSRPIPMGLGATGTNATLSAYQRREYEKILLDYPDRVVSSCIILHKMLGLGADKIIPLLKRFNKYDPPPPREDIFSEEEVLQHKKDFFAYWEELLRNECLSVEVNEIFNGWRFLFRDYQIGQVGFTQQGHWMQWIESAHAIDWDKWSEKKDDEQELYFRDTLGESISADGLTLQECKVIACHWIQYIRVLISEDEGLFK